MKQKFLRILLLAALFSVPWVGNAQNTLTVADGTVTNSYVPVYGYYADANLRCQIIYPANDIAAATTSVGMTGGSITGLTFYTTQSSVSLDGTFTVKMTEVTDVTLSGWQTLDASTLVYTGTVGVTGGMMSITLDAPYTYSGGNLLIEVAQTVSSSSYPTTTYYGVEATGASVQGYSYSGVDDISATQRNFIPKTTFTFTGGAAVTCAAVQSHGVVNVSSDGATIAWVDTINAGATYSVEFWSDSDTTTVTTTDTFYTFIGLDATTQYHYAVKVLCSATDESVAMVGSFMTECDGGECNMTAYVTDSYNDSWNGCAINIVQAGVTVATIECPSGQSGSTFTYAVCASVPVTLTFTRGSYTNELGGYITDGGGTTVFNIGSMGNYYTGDTLATVAIPCPSCLPPTALTVMPDSNQIEFSWTPQSGASQFIVYLNDSIVNDNVTDTFYVFTDLPANTAFNVRVQSVCSSDDSSSIASRSTRTACGQITLPYVVDFEDAAYNGAWYPCWDSVIHAGTDPSVNNNTVHQGNYSMYMQATGSESYNLVVSPQIPTAGNNIYVRFWANLASTSSGWLKCGVMTNPYDSSTFIPMVTVQGVSGWNEYEFNTDTLDGSATYYVAWLAYRSVSYNTRIASFDDVYIGEIPSCLRVPEVVFDTATSDELTFHWADNGSNSYTVYYWESGTTDTLSTVINDTVATLSGLESLTAYGLYVVANCSGSDAEPSPTYNYATVCAASTCNMTVEMTDSFGDGWNGGAVNFYQAGTQVGSATLSSGNSGTATVEVCSSAAVEVRVTPGSYPSEMSFVVYDGGSTAIYTAAQGSISGSAVLTTVANPCPNCVPPADIYLSDTTATGVTIHWTAQAGQSAWIVCVDSTYYTVTDTFYTVNNLPERTAHTIGVATDCSGDTSAFVSLPFITGCANGECEISVAANSGYYYYTPTLHVFQNGVEMATVCEGTALVGVCSGMAVDIIYQAPQYTYDYYTPSIVILDGGDDDIYSGTGAGFNTGDTLVSMANPCPTCLKPYNVVASQIDSNDLTFSWPVASNVTDYLVSFNGGAWTSVGTSGVYSATSLLANTAYTFSVRAICSVGDTSNIRTLTVKTSCGQMGLPFVEGFENDPQSTVPSCWTVVRPGYDVYPGVSASAYTGSNGLTLAANYNDSTTIATSLVPLEGDSIYVSFWASVNSGNTLQAGVMTDLAYDTTFIPLMSIPSNGSTYTLYEFNTASLGTTYTNVNLYVAFRLVTGSSNHYADLDDINIRKDEGCMYPSNLTATPSATSPSVTVSWTNTAAVNDFVVCYSTASNPWSTPVDVYSTSYTFSGLNYATTYYFHIGLVCGGDTLWSTISEATPCGTVTLPYVEIFDSPTGTLPPCWNYTNPSYFHWNRWTTHAETSGDGELMVGTGSAGEAAILPNFAAPINKIEISYNAKLGNVSEGDGMMMGVYDDSTNVVHWLDTLQITGQSRENFVRFTYNYLNYGGGYGNRIAIGHSHNNSSDWGFAIDSIVVLELPDCNPPENLTAHNTTYPNTADDVFFTWTVSGNVTPANWEIYIDTITSTTPIDSVDPADFIIVDTNYYHVPINMLADGAHYRFFVRSNCGGLMRSNWVELQNGFATDEFTMNNASTFDTIVGCDFIIYDNGGPVAGYLHNSNSNLIIQAGEVGRELQLQGGFFSHGADANTFTVYDGIGTSGEVLYQRTNTNMTETIDSVLATSSTGAMTITFTSGYYAALGYELYIHCVGAATCPRPTNPQVEMTGATTAHATWEGSASAYRVYHRQEGASIWNMLATTTNSVDILGLPVDVNYELCVVAVCSTTDTSAPSIIRHFVTHYVAPCDAVENIVVSDTTQTTATIDWTSTGSAWEIAIVGGSTFTTTTHPYTLTDLTAATTYQFVVRNVCDATTGYYSDWSDTVSFTTLPETPTYTITVLSNNDAWGSVFGGGTYAEGTEVTIRAEAHDGYHFVSWQDDNTEASRNITVTGDATYTATFEQNIGIDDIDGNTNVTLYPNPASTTVTVRGLESGNVVAVMDMNGREVARFEVRGSELDIDLTGFARGAYFVRVTGANTSVIRKLVVR